MVFERWAKKMIPGWKRFSIWRSRYGAWCTDLHIWAFGGAHQFSLMVFGEIDDGSGSEDSMAGVWGDFMFK